MYIIRTYIHIFIHTYIYFLLVFYLLSSCVQMLAAHPPTHTLSPALGTCIVIVFWRCEHFVSVSVCVFGCECRCVCFTSCFISGCFLLISYVYFYWRWFLFLSRMWYFIQFGLQLNIITKRCVAGIIPLLLFPLPGRNLKNVFLSYTPFTFIDYWGCSEYELIRF